MTSSPNSTGACQFVDLLATFQPSDILQHRQCREAVFGFIERSENTFRDELLERIKRPRKRRRRDSGTTSSQTNAEAFFANQKRIHRETGHDGRQGSPDVQRLLQAVKDLEVGMNTSPESYSGPYDQAEDTTPSDANRQWRTIAKLDNIEKTSHTTEGRRRLRLLRIVYEIEHLQDSAQRVRRTSSGKVESDIAAAERAFSDLSGVDATRVNSLRMSARSYVNIANQKNGLGVLLMLGSQSRHLWERFSELAFSWLWQFCEENLQHVIAKAQILQTTACQLVEGEFRESGADLTELREDGHVFSRHFKHPQSGPFRPDQGPGLNALAMAAEIFHGISQENMALGPARQEGNGGLRFPNNAVTDHVTELGETVETQSTVPPTTPAVEDCIPWGTSSNTDEDWNSMMLAIPEFSDWFDMPRM